VVDAIKQAMGSFVSFTFFTKFLCGVNQIVTVIAVVQIQNLRQAFMSKSRDLMSRNVNMYTGVPELADQTYSAFSFVITENNSV
jgi:hypothetical protein